MKKILLFALPLLAMIAVSCEKDNGQDGNPSGLKLVKEIKTSYNEGDYTINSFEYDRQGRMIKHTVTWYSDYAVDDICYYTHKYSGNEIISTAHDSDGDELTVKHMLNDEGYLVRHSVFDYEDDFYYILTYKNGYVSSMKEHTSSGREEQIDVEWKDGNVVEENVEYTDFVNVTNIEFSAIGIMGGYTFANFGIWELPAKWKGFSNKNLVKKTKEDGVEYLYEYEFDTDGYPVKINVTNTENNSHYSTITYYE